MHPVITGKALALLLIAGACVAPDSVSETKPDEKSEQASVANASMMVAVHSPEGAFLIDRFEVSELSKGDFFSARNQIPATNVTMEDARKICNLLGKRLCTEYEWKNACLGAQRLRFAYGNQSIHGRCNVQSAALLPAGVKVGCMTDSGVYDMIGNAMEWVETEDRAVAMGGSFLAGAGSDCFSAQFFPQGAMSDQVGFRCCMSGGKR